jgi:hypothetical protein
MITTNRARQLRELIEKATASLDDADALDCVTLFPAWAPDTEYGVDQRVEYSQKLYRVVQAHTSQSGWEPDVTPALFTEVAKPGEIPVWKQPTGAQDAYMTGDKVHYPTKDDPVYVSIVDNNTWAPDVYGWERA